LKFVLFPDFKYGLGDYETFVKRYI